MTFVQNLEPIIEEVVRDADVEWVYDPEEGSLTLGETEPRPDTYELRKVDGVLVPFPTDDEWTRTQGARVRPGVYRDYVFRSGADFEDLIGRRFTINIDGIDLGPFR